jgi:alpha-1,2-glucosyltransferase
VICAISIALDAMNHIRVVLLAILPQLTILFLFAVFVVWNGGVVLGDKSNHVATIHTPQMLYVCAYILFFSFPVILPGAVKQLYQFSSGLATEATGSARRSSSLQLFSNSSKPVYIISRILLFLALVGVAFVAIHYNTIVHPFTLADNRHYVFYVFRILRRHWFVKYAAAPVYVVCAWLAINALGQDDEDAAQVNPSTAPGSPKEVNRTRTSDVSASSKTTTVTTSFVLIWLATTTLTLITAPLVEPRYYIMSWIVWRLHVLSAPKGGRLNSTTMLSLWAETAWFLLVNLVTGYMFLYKGFEWPQEPGAVQRFMW